MGSPYYDKVDIDLLFDKHRGYLEEIARNMAKGIASTITPETSEEDLAALENGYNYSLGKKGTYKFSPALQIVEGVAENELPVGYDVIVAKNNDNWFVVSVIELPKYDDAPILERISAIEQILSKKVDMEEGKGLSTNDFTDLHKSKVEVLKTDGDGKTFLNSKGEYVKNGGSGSGFYNVTQKFPKADGYYDFSEAIGYAYLDEDLEEGSLRGMLLTFEITQDVWQDYRYLASNKDGLNEPTNWEEYGARNVVKKVTITQGVDTKSLTPDSNGNINIEIPTTDVDDSLTEGGTNAVQGGAIYAHIENKTAELGSKLILNTIEEGVYTLSLLNDNDEVISTTEAFSGGGSGGGGTVTNVRVVLTKITENVTVKQGDKVNLSFFYDQQDLTGSSTGVPATATITVAKGSNSYSYNIDLVAGATQTIDVTSYLSVGASNVRVRVVTNDEYAQVASIAWTVNVIELKLESSFNIATATKSGNSLSLPFALTGAGTKNLELYVNGVKKEDRAIVSTSSTGAFTVPTTDFAHGTHSVQIVANLTLSNGEVISSNSIYFNIVVYVEGRTSTLFGARFDYPDGRIIQTNAKPELVAGQYSNYSIIYAVYSPTQTYSQVNVVVNSEILSKASVQFSRTEVVGRSYASGTYPGYVESNNQKLEFNLEVSQLGVDLIEPTDRLLLKLSGDGKSNSGIDKNEWTYNSITTKLENFTFTGDGWINGALRVLGTAKATINFEPLSQSNTTNNAFTFSTRLKVSNASDPTVKVLSCMDATGVGFEITGQEAKMVTRAGSIVTTKFAEGNEYNIGFVSFPPAGPDSTEDEKTNASMLYLYVDGVISGGVLRGTGDNIYQNTPTKITLKADSKCTLDVYSMRSYAKALTDSEMLNSYLIDLDDSNVILDKFLENNILDQSGNISVEGLPKYIPYMIITGKAENNRAMVLEAAAINNKDTKYDIDEILYVNPLDPSMNFKNVGGCIRLQGTSSLAYPIKNYRIYFQNKSKVNGVLTQGVDKAGNGGTLVESTKYSFKKATTTQKQSIPVNCFCLKADYAESSSSHNTGTARIVHEVHKASGDLTPVQKKVSSSYNYDVRTTIDGFPIIVFYRATSFDEPVFLSKFNFNNDKSTEDVFGFKGIPGYHDQSWVTDKFSGVNPTECWEFLNNDYPMGMFLDTDFTSKGEDGKTNWSKVFEARFVADEADVAKYEDGSKEPYYLKRLVTWVNSTDTTVAGLTADQKAARALKFKTELSDYFDVKHLASYYQITEILGAVDQRVKNMMMAFYYDPDKDKVLAYMIFYDNDTILGVRNDGKLKYNWDIDYNTTDPELGTDDRPVYAFAGRKSVLWENLRTQFQDELASAYVRIRGKLTNDFIFNMYNVEQSDKYVERVYNIDAIQKYVIPATQGVLIDPNNPNSVQVYSYLELMQGPRTSQRQWWLTNRLNLLDARYVAGNYKSTDLTFKGNSASGATIKAVASRPYNFTFTRESAILSQKAVVADEVYSFTYGQEANIGTIFHFYGGDWAKKIDLSGWGGFTSINVPRLKVLEEFILGKDGLENTLPSIQIGSALPVLKKIDIRNFTELATIDLSQSLLLEEVNAKGCTKLANIRLGQSSPVNKLILPKNFKNLSLVGLPNITNAGITFENIGALETIQVENSVSFNGFALLESFVNVLTTSDTKRYLRIEIGNATTTNTFVRKLYSLNLGGLDASGNLVQDKVYIKGTLRMDKSIPTAELNTIKLKFPELTILQPAVTIIEYDTITSNPYSLSNLDNNTGFKFGNKYVPSGVPETMQSLRKKVLTKRVSNRILFHEIDTEKGTLKGSSIVPQETTTYGVIMIVEPKHYVKGFNDVLNNKNYVLWSLEEQPNKLYEVLVPTVANESYVDVINSNTIADLTKFDLTYVVNTVTIPTGSKFIRFPSVVSSNNSAGWAFVDKYDVILSKKATTFDTSNFIDGAYVVEKVPEEAVKLIYTTALSLEGTKEECRITKSSNMYDLADWNTIEKSYMSAGHNVNSTSLGLSDFTKRIPNSMQLVNNFTVYHNLNNSTYNTLMSNEKYYGITKLTRRNALVHFFMALTGTINLTKHVGVCEKPATNTDYRYLTLPNYVVPSYTCPLNYCTTPNADSKSTTDGSTVAMFDATFGYVGITNPYFGYFVEDNEFSKLKIYTKDYTFTKTLVHGDTLSLRAIPNRNIVITKDTYMGIESINNAGSTATKLSLVAGGQLSNNPDLLIKNKLNVQWGHLALNIAESINPNSGFSRVQVREGLELIEASSPESYVNQVEII